MGAGREGLVTQFVFGVACVSCCVPALLGSRRRAAPFYVRDHVSVVDGVVRVQGTNRELK